MWSERSHFSRIFYRIDSVNGKLDRIKLIESYYGDSKKNIQKAQETVFEHEKVKKNHEDQIRKISEESKKITKLLETAQTGVILSKTALAKAEEESKMIKARMQFLYADLVKSELQETTAEEKPDKNCCNICLEKYSSPDRQESALPCGHRFCFFCLSALKQKTCPTCRKPFTVEQIYKLF